MLVTKAFRQVDGCVSQYKVCCVGKTRIFGLLFLSKSFVKKCVMTELKLCFYLCKEGTWLCSVFYELRKILTKRALKMRKK